MVWYLRTVSGVSHAFSQQGIDKDRVSPLETIPDFVFQEQYCIDAGGNEELFKQYPVFPEDDSFVLIPKGEIKDVWWEYGQITKLGE